MKIPNPDLKITISLIGAGSTTFTPYIFSDICRTPILKKSTVILYDLNHTQSELMAQACQKFSDEIGSGIKIKVVKSQVEAIKPADFVINCALSGGWDTNLKIKQIIKKHTGIVTPIEAHARFSQLNFLLSVAKDIELLNPNAVLIQCANPISEAGTLINLKTKVKFIGVCHGSKKLDQVCGLIGVRPEKTDAIVAGINHNIWLTDFKSEGVDLYPRLNSWIRNVSPMFMAQSLSYLKSADYQISPAALDIFRYFNLFPVGDTARASQPHMWRWHRNAECEKKYYGPTQGRDSTIGFEKKMAERNNTGDKLISYISGNLLAGDIFPVGYSEWPVIPIISSIISGISTRQVVNIPNNGIIPFLPKQLIIEITADVTNEGVKPLKNYLLTDKVVSKALTPHSQQIENHVNAYLNHDTRYLIAQIMQNKVVKDLSTAHDILQIWLDNDPGMAKHFTL